MKIRAHVRNVTGLTSNLVGTIRGGIPVIDSVSPPASVVEIVETENAYLYFRYTRDGSAAGDSWFESLDEAKAQALFEFGILIDDWSPVES